MAEPGSVSDSTSSADDPNEPRQASRWGRMAGAAAITWVLAGTLFGDFTTFIAFDHRAVGRAILDGAIPYRDFTFEYPPGAAGILAAPAVAGREGYDIVFRVIMAGVWIAMLQAMWKRARAGIPGFLLGSVGLTFVIGGGFDVVVSAAVMAAFFAYRSGTTGWAGVWLGVGTLVKIVPAVLLPVIARGSSVRKTAGLVLIGTISIGMAVGAPALLADDGDDPLGYHAGRLLHAESLIGSGIVLQRIATDDAYPIVFDHGSRNIEDADSARLISTVLMVVALATLWLRARPDAPATWSAILLAIPALGPVASPQFLLWPLAFAGLLPRGARLSFVGAAVLSASMFTGPYPGEGTTMALLTAGRNLALVTAFALSAREALRRPTEGSD